MIKPLYTAGMADMRARCGEKTDIHVPYMSQTTETVPTAQICVWHADGEAGASAHFDRYIVITLKTKGL